MNGREVVAYQDSPAYKLNLRIHQVSLWMGGVTGEELKSLEAFKVRHLCLYFMSDQELTNLNPMFIPETLNTLELVQLTYHPIYTSHPVPFGRDASTLRLQKKKPLVRLIVRSCLPSSLQIAVSKYFSAFLGLLFYGLEYQQLQDDVEKRFLDIFDRLGEPFIPLEIINFRDNEGIRRLHQKKEDEDDRKERIENHHLKVRHSEEAMSACLANCDERLYEVPSLKIELACPNTGLLAAMMGRSKAGGRRMLKFQV